MSLLLYSFCDAVDVCVNHIRTEGRSTQRATVTMIGELLYVADTYYMFLAQVS